VRCTTLGYETLNFYLSALCGVPMVLSQFCRIRRCWSFSHSPTFVPPPTILPNANNERSFSPSKYCSHYVFLPFYHSTLLLRLRIVVSKIYHISSFFFSCCFPWTLSVRYLFGAIPSDSYNVILSLISIQPFRFTLPVFLNIPLTRQTTVNRLKYTGLLEMVVGVLTTCHTHYTWDTSMYLFLFNRTLPSFCYIPYRCSICATFTILRTSIR